MKKLFEKSKIGFTVIWIIVYIIGSSVFDNISKMIGIEKSFTLVFHLMLCILLLIWIIKNKLCEYYGLCKPREPASKMLFYIPLFVVASCNLWFGICFNMPVLETVLYILSMLCVGFLEELLMRAFLFNAIAKQNEKMAVIISSLTFGIGHIVNLFNGSGADLLPTICQVCYAIAIGFMFVTVFQKCKSLIPCIITHGVVNALNAFLNNEAMTNEIQIAVSVMLIVISAAYSFFLIRRRSR